MLSQKSAIRFINKNGILLVFPVNNQKEPNSLWREFFPRSKMKWEWNESGDNRVGDMWLLMKKLSDCREVVYSKWYKGRATFFSRELFTALLKTMNEKPYLLQTLSRTSQNLLDTLESDSPLSTKELKKMTDLQGKYNEAEYSRGLKDLFSKLLVIAYGEVEDGAFPSLAVGSTKNIYEDLWTEAQSLSLDQAQSTIKKYMPEGSLTEKFLTRVLKTADLTDEEVSAIESVRHSQGSF